MDEPLVLVTGFGPFPGCAENPSREVARALELQPPQGVRVAARELPVSFRGAPAAVRAAVREIAPQRPVVLLGLGVQPEPGFRLERRARGIYSGARADNDGHTPDGLALAGLPERSTDLDLEALAQRLCGAGAGNVRLSDDAGGYVCEITYHALLTAAEELGVSALFLHIPPIDVLSSAEQTRMVRGLVAALVRRPVS